jgi:molybdopterin-containing oxidoreductase family iron-sulfur binding subunit
MAPDTKCSEHGAQDGAVDLLGDLEQERLAVGEGRLVLSRRGFLKLAGFAFAGTALGGCQRAPVQYALPYLNPPDEITPGRAYDYASTCGGCSAGCGLLIKTRDGRPIKLEGNPEHPLSHGGLCAAGQASLLGLYDQQRLQHPLHSGQTAEWPAVDQAVVAQLTVIRKQKGAVRFLSGPGLSPTARALLNRFLGTFANARQIIHDPRSCSAIQEAHSRTHGVRVLPHYHFDKALVIVSFDADFLGTWVSPVEFTAAYQAGRRLDGPAPQSSYHVQFESRLSLSGTKADRRLTLAPAELGAAMKQLATRLAKIAGEPAPDGILEESSIPADFLDYLAETLWQHRQRSLILCGSEDVELQVLDNYLNHLLGNYGSTVDVAQPSYQKEGNERDLATLLQELRDGKVAALLVCDSNPVHDLPDGDRIAEDLKRVPLLVSLAPRLDETARLAQIVCPDHHFLEAWNDAEPVNGLVSLVQPAITPLGETRSVLESLAIWTGKPSTAHELLRERWRNDVFPRAPRKGTFDEFWDHTLVTGFAEVRPQTIKVENFKRAAVRFASPASRAAVGTFSLVLYPKVGIPDASHAYNPWLQELPDPISKVTWDNYACLSPQAAASLGVKDGDVVRLEAPAHAGRPVTLELPAFVVPGQHDEVVAVALGYGSVLSERFAKIGPPWLQAGPTVGPDGFVGKNGAPYLEWVAGGLRTSVTGVSLNRTGTQHALASTQSYHQITVPPKLAVPGQDRPRIIREGTLASVRQEAASTNKRTSGEVGRMQLPVVAGPPGEAPGTEAREDLWPRDHPFVGAHWGMVIDLSACTGCSACVIACQAENNIPVVGKDEVRRQREMHWLRIDRYFTEADGQVEVAHQPMLCQHCVDAPCEVVCPVLATVHSDEGLNEQVYNRCVGTRYCANNCPYKVRRFNWFDYAHDDLLHNLVLNPDVTVRSRGVMEKCTFCVQRIEEAKVEARRLGQPLRDGALQTACQQSCPARAITFGNLNDSTSRVRQLAAGPRGYQVLAELNVKPSVTYLSLVRNRPAAGEGEKHG